MLQFIRKCLSFEKLMKLITDIPYKTYHVIMLFLILSCLSYNYSSDHRLPLIWALIVGFVVIVYLDIYSIKQTYSFYNNIAIAMAGDSVLLLARTKLHKRLYSNRNLIIILIFPLLILPVVIYIIQCQLGNPIKIFAYSALYIILALCFIGYMQYIYLIMLAHDCSKNANEISVYCHDRPHRTEWVVELASLLNRQSNMFFLVGSCFIALLYLITFTNYYGVHMDELISKTCVFYLWAIVALAIVIMFPIFSLLGFLYIKKIISKLVQNAIKEYNSVQNIVKWNKKKQKYLELLLTLNQIKVIMLEKTPEYPQKPLAAYAVSCVIALINFLATVQSAISLIEYIP